MIGLHQGKHHIVVTQPLKRDGGMAEDHGVPGDGKFYKPGLEVVERASGAKSS